MRGSLIQFIVVKLKMLLSVGAVNSAAGCLFIQAERRLSLIFLLVYVSSG